MLTTSYKPFRNKENQAIKALRNENGELISDPEGVAEIYSEYISTLYGPDSGESPDTSPSEEESACSTPRQN